MNTSQFKEIKRKHDMDIPFNEEERKLLLAWKIKQVLTEPVARCTVGEIYEKLGVIRA